MLYSARKYCATTFGRQSIVLKSTTLVFRVFKPVSECVRVLKGSSRSVLLLLRDKWKDRIHTIAFSFICFTFQSTLCCILLPLLAEWHTLKQKCCEVVLSPTSLFKKFFFSDIITYTCYNMKKKKVSFTGNVCHMFHSTFGCILFINKIKVGYMRLFLLVINTAASELALTHTHMHIHTHECVQCSSSSLLIKH